MFSRGHILDGWLAKNNVNQVSTVNRFVFVYRYNILVQQNKVLEGAVIFIQTDNCPTTIMLM